MCFSSVALTWQLLGLVITAAVAIMKVAVAIMSVGEDAPVARLITSVALAKSVVVVAVRQLAALAVAQGITSVLLANSAAAATAKAVAPMLD